MYEHDTSEKYTSSLFTFINILQHFPHTVAQANIQSIRLTMKILVNEFTSDFAGKRK